MSEHNIQRVAITLDNLRTALACLEDRQIITLANVRICLRHMRQATASLQALERSLIGVPEPETGENEHKTKE